MTQPSDAVAPRTDPLHCEDCGHHLHRPDPGKCQWYDCPCGPVSGDTKRLLGTGEAELLSDAELRYALSEARCRGLSEAAAPTLALRGLDNAIYMLDAWVVHHRNCTVVTEGTRSEISGGYRWTPGDQCSCGLAQAQADLAAARAALSSDGRATGADPTLEERMQAVLADLRKIGPGNPDVRASERHVEAALLLVQKYVAGVVL